MWEIWGAVISIVTGTLLHFVYHWSADNKIAAIFASVNESTWEHLKIAFWPMLLVAMIEWLFWGRKTKNYCLATLIKLIATPMIIVGLFYGWTAVFHDSLIADIAFFIIAVIAGYYLGYLMLRVKKDQRVSVLSGLLITLLVVLFGSLTYYAPENFLFKDPVYGGYGIDSSSGVGGLGDSGAGDKILIRGDDGVKYINLSDGSTSYAVSELSRNYSAYSGLPAPYQNDKESLDLDNQVISEDGSRFIVTYVTHDRTASPNEFDGSLPILKSDEYTCIVADKLCSTSNLLSSAQKATGNEAAVFVKWDSAKNMLYGHYSGEGIGSSAPIFKYDIGQRTISKTLGFDPFTETQDSRWQGVNAGAFGPGLKQAVIIEKKDYSLDALIIDLSTLTDTKRIRLEKLPFSNKYDNVNSVAWSPDQKSLAIGLDQKIVLMNLATEKVITLYEDSVQSASGLYWDRNAIVYSPDGRYICFVDYQNSENMDGSWHYDNSKDSSILKAVDLNDDYKVSDVIKGKYLSLVY